MSMTILDRMSTVLVTVVVTLQVVTLISWIDFLSQPPDPSSTDLGLCTVTDTYDLGESIKTIRMQCPGGSVSFDIVAPVVL